LKNKEQELLNEWKKIRNNFISDGIVNIENYEKSKIKVLYILKEVNGGSNWDLRNFLDKDGGRYQTWSNIARWQYGIENYKDSDIWDKIEKIDGKFRKRQLKNISVINLKKESGKATSNMNEIWEYAWNDRDFLKKQISIYKPNIIVCCGTGEIVKKYKLVEDEFIENWAKSNSGLNYYITNSKQMIISHCHPQKRDKNRVKFETLIKTVKEIFSDQLK
jgi:hypothetical protein